MFCSAYQPGGSADKECFLGGMNHEMYLRTELLMRTYIKKSHKNPISDTLCCLFLLKSKSCLLNFRLLDWTKFSKVVLMAVVVRTLTLATSHLWREKFLDFLAAGIIFLKYFRPGALSELYKQRLGLFSGQTPWTKQSCPVNSIANSTAELPPS